MKIILLTHERELDRSTNTGSIALKYSGSGIERILWERVSPNPQLLKLIEDNQALLLYSEGDEPLSSIEEYDNIVIIDSTWQESKKIFNRSSYLKAMPRVSLAPAVASSYSLRRNQTVGGLCTIECVIEVLKIKGENALASQLESDFIQFNHAVKK